MKRRTFPYGAALAVLLLLVPVAAGRHLPPSGVDEVLHNALYHKCVPDQRPLQAGSISQWDALIRHAADSIGWDWRLLAAVIYHESRFHNEALSAKGARGLMQIRSARYTPEELANPARNLSVGTRYLKKLENRYADNGPVEAIKFALASYNLGDGRVASLVSRADTRGLDASRWDEVATLLPKGHHTVAYVNDVMGTYVRYARKYPLD